MPTDRMERLQAVMALAGIDLVLLSGGADLAWLTGYEAMPLERLTMLVVPRGDRAELIVPELEAPRVREHPDRFSVYAWDEGEDPIDRVVAQAGSPSVVAIGDRTWSRFLLALQDRLRSVRDWRLAGGLVGPLRARKDPEEIEALGRAAAAADRVAVSLLDGEVPLIGRTEAAVSSDLGRRLIAEGHRQVNFAIVAAGPNAASPHHTPGDRVIGPGEVVLCDFGGRMDGPDGLGYCSDITRCVFTGSVPDAFGDLYSVLGRAQAEAVAAVRPGVAGEQVDRVARTIITEAGYGDRFIHRTGHGIGLDEHEDPYIVAGNVAALAPGHAFSIEPGIYVPHRWGARLEDIVVVTEGEPMVLNQAPRGLAVVDA